MLMRNKPLLVISEYDATTPCYTKERSLCNRTVHEVKGILTAGDKTSDMVDSCRKEPVMMFNAKEHLIIVTEIAKESEFSMEWSEE